MKFKVHLLVCVLCLFVLFFTTPLYQFRGVEVEFRLGGSGLQTRTKQLNAQIDTEREPSVIFVLCVNLQSIECSFLEK